MRARHNNIQPEYYVDRDQVKTNQCHIDEIIFSNVALAIGQDYKLKTCGTAGSLAVKSVGPETERLNRQVN
jgi:hypothetical protein